MADIRINALATTAASTASDDFIAVDGSANGTRKLNAYSPTFGGNLTVSGTGNNQIGGSGAKIGLGTAPNASAGTYIKSSSGYTLLVDTGRTDAGTTGIFLRDNAGSVRGWVGFDPTGTTLQISGNGGGTAIGDNLTVSGGTAAISVGNGSAATLQLNQTGVANAYLAQNATTGNLALGNGNGDQVTITRANGNLLVGVGLTDGGQKLQVSGTAAITGQTILGSSAISSNQLLSIKKDTANFGLIGLSNSNTAGYSSIELFDNTSTQTGAIGYGNASVGVTGVRGKVYMYSTGDIAFLSGGTTTALTLDSSQRCILAGALRLNNAYVAGAPTATGYVTLQDSAGNTYKVLVGT